MSAARKPLRAVKPGEGTPEPVAPPKPPTLLEAIAEGDYLGILQAQRRDIVAELPNTNGAPYAALQRQLSILSKEIAALEVFKRTEAAEDGDVADDEAFDAAAL